jgi:hemerythrin
MKTLVWNVQYSVGDPTIDKQHARLFDIAGRLARSVGKEEDKLMLSTTIAELKEYAERHFAFEEALLEKANYGELESHKKMHAIMRTRLDLMAGQLGQNLLTRQELEIFLEEWLTLHILREDLKYVSALLKSSM